MNEDDKKNFLEDFKKANVQQKVDMWFYALDQAGLWDQIITEMSFIANASLGPKAKITEEE
jgi:hypothetical protein